MKLTQAEEQVMKHLWNLEKAYMKNIVKDFFNDSTSQFASFFTKESDLSIDEMEELKEIHEDKIKKQQK